MHEAAHRFFCDLTDTPVYEVSYFRPLGNPAGYVSHGRPRSLRAGLLISGGPLLINTVLCAALTLSVAYETLVRRRRPERSRADLPRLARLLDQHARHPSRQGAASFTAQVKEARGQGVTLLLARGVSGLITLANALRIVWFDAIYAIGVSLVIPALLGTF